MNEFELATKTKIIIDTVLSEHGRKSNAALKKSVYFSRPMRNILMLEREMKISLYNTPIVFSSKDIV